MNMICKESVSKVFGPKNSTMKNDNARMNFTPQMRFKRNLHFVLKGLKESIKLDQM